MEAKLLPRLPVAQIGLRSVCGSVLCTPRKRIVWPGHSWKCVGKAAGVATPESHISQQVIKLLEWWRRLQYKMEVLRQLIMGDHAFHTLAVWLGLNLCAIAFFVRWASTDFWMCKFWKVSDCSGESLLHGSPYIYLQKSQINSDGKMRCHKEFIILPFK